MAKIIHSIMNNPQLAAAHYPHRHEYCTHITHILQVSFSLTNIHSLLAVVLIKGLSQYYWTGLMRGHLFSEAALHKDKTVIAS